ncbi:MAG: hypothetical protein RBT20_06140 [Syntrophales bacterium]|jgi:hypothetical protein|nr:hypothetical protein [Syntrophales bacterium]
MKFGPIDHIILFGGAPLLAAFARDLADEGKYAVSVFSSRRHLDEVLAPAGKPLRAILQDAGIPWFDAPDIHTDPNIRGLLSPRTFGLGLGEAWSFSPDLIERFGGRLLDFMGIRLPQYRGGAHYSWQILRRNRIGCCNLQVINEQMIQGVFDSGEIVKSREYLFPASVRIPQDYFDFAVGEEVAFLREFLREIEGGKDFPLTRLQENFSLYFPRLHTLKHGWIDWGWSGEEIERFICAFDEPYAGASTFLGEARVFLKDARLETNDGPFHPFQSGLIYKKANGALFVCAREGALVIRKASDEGGRDILDDLAIGSRFHTPARFLEEARQCRADYDAAGPAASQRRETA